MKTSNLFSLNWQDVLKALIVAILTPIIPIVENSLQSGTFTLNWHNMGVAAAGGAFAYLVKNFLTPASVVSKVQADADKK